MLFVLSSLLCEVGFLWCAVGFPVICLVEIGALRCLIGCLRCEFGFRWCDIGSLRGDIGFLRCELGVILHGMVCGRCSSVQAWTSMG